MIQFDDGIIERNSPARRAVPRHAPLALVYGALEQRNFADQASLMAARWQAVGNRCTIEAHAQCDHFSILNGFDSADAALTRALKALAKP